MADVFISHLECTGAAKGPTRDPATFSRDLDVSVDAMSLPMSSAPATAAIRRGRIRSNSSWLRSPRARR
jgi:hypothetical protein